jgi:subtilase family serine protease
VRVVLKGQRAPWALPQNSQGVVPGETMLQHLTVVLKRSPQQQQAFEQFLQQLQDPSSRNYHHFLTPVQIGKRFGASQHDIAAVSGWLRAQGLRVDAVANSRMMIDFSGNASEVGAAFATEMRYYEVNGEKRIATANDPQIPAALACVIQSVSGLYTIKYRPYYGARKAHKAQGVSPAATFCDKDVCTNFIFPADFAEIYDLNSVTVDGTGQTIGIIGRSRVLDADVENFQSLSGLATKDPTVIIPPLGVDPGPPAGTGGTASGDQVEATLDVTRSTSIAPGATIDLIVSASTETEDGIQIAAEYAVNTDPIPAQIMNISFGACENPAGGGGGQAEDQYWDSLFSAAAGEGISVFVAAGDAGAAGCDAYFAQPPAQQYLSINSICASSYSTCVGGTEFADTADPAKYWNQNPVQAPPFESALSYIPEGGWNEPLSGAVTQAAAGGGGFSVYIPTPSWQTGTGVPGTEGRYTPDIAFSASGHDGYFGCLAAGGGDCVVVDGGFNFEYFFGTSAAAPDMAGITALLNQQVQAPQGELNQRLYQLATIPTNLVFNDVTVASSGVSSCVVTTPSMCNNSTPSPTALTGGLAGYLVTAGYDEVTGLGSVNGANLLSSWVAPTFTLSTPNTPGPVLSGESATSTFSVTPAGGATTFASNVALALTGLPANTTYTFSTNPILAGSKATNETLTITTAGPNGSQADSRRHIGEKRFPLLPLALPLAGIAMVGFAGRKISKYSVLAGLCVSVALLGLLVACGSNPPVTIAVSPSGATVWASDTVDGWPPQTAQFTATVTNTNNTAVSWSLVMPPENAGSISSTGVYTAPTVSVSLPASVTVTATSQADTTKTATAIVTITPTTVPGSYPLTVTATEETTVNTGQLTLTVQ